MPRRWQWNSLGILNLERAGLAPSRAHRAPRLCRVAGPGAKGTTLQFAFIDGWHTFDYVLIDFFYLDNMLDAAVPGPAQ